MSKLLEAYLRHTDSYFYGSVLGYWSGLVGGDFYL